MCAGAPSRASVGGVRRRVARGHAVAPVATPHPSNERHRMHARAVTLTRDSRSGMNRFGRSLIHALKFTAHTRR